VADDLIKIRGAEQWAAVAKAMRSADKELRREAYKAVNRTVRPLNQDVLAGMPAYLPDNYARALGPTFRTRTRRRGGRTPGIRLEGQARTPEGQPRSLRPLDAGRLRHPLFGNRGFWFNQPVKKGFWTKTLTESAPKIRRELVEVIGDLADKIARST
jgi:hypothetical protein